MEYVTLAK